MRMFCWNVEAESNSCVYRVEGVMSDYEAARFRPSPLL